MSGKKRKKRVSKKITPGEVLEDISKNISKILLDMGLYPGTEDFDEMYQCLINALAEEIKPKVIKLVRKTIDS